MERGDGGRLRGPQTSCALMCGQPGFTARQAALLCYSPSWMGPRSLLL